MHHSPNTPSTPPQLSRRLLLCALSAWSLDTPAAAHIPGPPRPPPYLLVVAPPPLRFEPLVEPASPVALAPIAAGPPHPAGLYEEIASNNQHAALPVAPPSAHPPASAGAIASVPPPPVPPDAGAAPSPGVPPAARPPESDSILPDDTPREIRPQEVLMYFRFPGALPPSSATYQQK